MGTDKITSNDSRPSENEIKRYLYAEMQQEERDDFEERLFLNNDLFFETADLENHLVDSYAGGTLGAESLMRFERSLEKIPERRQKVANALSLGKYIDDERPVAKLAADVEHDSLFRRFFGIFAVRTPALGYAMGALLVILAVSTGFLVLQNQQKNAELATLQQQNLRQTELEKELESLHQKESELQAAVDNERETSGDFAEELETERNRRIEIERELEKLKTVKEPVETAPIIASLVLSPAGTRGGSDGGTPVVKIGPATKRLSMRLNLPDDVQKEERLTVSLNQKHIARDVAPRSSGAKKIINITIPTVNLLKGKNQLDVRDADGRAVSSYSFRTTN